MAQEEDQISFAEYARTRGVSRETVRRWAEAGKLGPVCLREGAKIKGKRLSRAWLEEHGLLNPAKALITELFDAIATRACEVFADEPKTLVQFTKLFERLWPPDNGAA
jgi:hypothetical protein